MEITAQLGKAASVALRGRVWATPAPRPGRVAPPGAGLDVSLSLGGRAPLAPVPARTCVLRAAPEAGPASVQFQTHSRIARSHGFMAGRFQMYK